MIGPGLIVRSMTRQRIPDQHGNNWQYHPQSDRHSKIACWAVLFDLMLSCPLLRKHAESGKVGFGINHSMVDFTSGREKNLDLVLSVPRDAASTAGARTFSDLAKEFDLDLLAAERSKLERLPLLERRAVGDVLVALEAKAAMGAHVRAGPRFYDELTSAWQCINGSSPSAIAVGMGMVNASEEFISPKMNKFPMSERDPVVGREKQPAGVGHIEGRMRSLKVRGHTSERGYDAIGLLAITARNDGSHITVAPVPPSLPSSDPLNYERMVLRVAGLYDGRFQNR